MLNKFGYLIKLEFLQDFASTVIAKINPFVQHNISKYYAIKNAHYLSIIEDIEGDYLEFGVYSGSSLCHSIRCYQNLAKLNAKPLNTKFFGFDSFAGFGQLSNFDNHPFYVDQNFSNNHNKVVQRVSRMAGGIKFQIIPGFFKVSLRIPASQYGIKKSRIIFIDSDTYSSAVEALTFCIPTLQEGTLIILDDFYSYRGSETKGVARAYFEFIAESNIKVRHLFSYGAGGVVYVVSAMPR